MINAPAFRSRSAECVSSLMNSCHDGPNRAAVDIAPQRTP